MYAEKMYSIEVDSIQLADKKKIIWELQETKTGLAQTGIRNYIFIVDEGIDDEDNTINTVLYDISDMLFARQVFDCLKFIVQNLTT